MLIDFERPGELHSSRLEADICIVGAGAAGLTLAKQLASLARRVLLLEAGGRVNPTRRGRTLWRVTKGTARWARTLTDPLLPWLRLQLGTAGVYLSVRGEQALNPASRVRLLEACDALGMPRLALDWRFSELDTRTLRLVAAGLGGQLDVADGRGDAMADGSADR